MIISRFTSLKSFSEILPSTTAQFRLLSSPSQDVSFKFSSMSMVMDRSSSFFTLGPRTSARFTIIPVLISLFRILLSTQFPTPSSTSILNIGRVSP